MSNGPYSRQVCNALKAIDGFTIEELPRLHTYSADTSERVLKELIMFACCPSNTALITLGRKHIQRINRKWRLEHILDAAKECLDFSDDWEYQRFLELIDLSAFELLKDAILIGKDSDNAEVKEASQDFEEYYEHISAQPDENFCNEMLKSVSREEPLWQIAEIAYKYKVLGMSRDHMYKLLESIREETKTVAQEDAILNLMDLMFGWCLPELRIYED